MTVIQRRYRTYISKLAQIERDRDFIKQANIGGEYIDPEKVERIKAIGAQRWRGTDDKEQEFFGENEIYNLCIGRGTLTAEERKIINDHVVVTIEMLEALPFPENLRRVPEYAGGHHEKMDGTGYPRGLMGSDMSIPARMMAIADIFEALTAADRPYKSGKTLSETLRIMNSMSKGNHIDPDLFRLFLDHGLHMKYAKEHMNKEQIDDVDLSEILDSKSNNR